MNRKKDVILKATEALTENYKKEELFMPKNNRELPSRAAIIDSFSYFSRILLE